MQPERNMNMSTNTNRIDYIDLAKGFCILLVIFHHVALYYHYRYSGWIPLRSFRMPLYYILSGIFFRQYSGFFDFIKRKTNKLVIPFIFFYLLLSVPLTIFMKHYSILDALLNFVYDNKFKNGSVWFLLSLFEVNIIFYLILSVSNRLPNKGVILAALSLLCGLAGLYFSYIQFNCYFFIDTSLTAVPFFYIGYLLGWGGQKALRRDFRWWQDILIVLLSVSYVLLFSRDLNFGLNNYSNYYSVYPCGILGTIAVLVISRRIGRLPLVSYIGRYSIIALCTHQVVLIVNGYFLKHVLGDVYTSVWINFFITVLEMLVVIPLLRRYLPYFTAQKDLIPIQKNEKRRE